MTAIAAWPLQIQDWLDQRGRPAWIAAMVLGFIAFWPLARVISANHNSDDDGCSADDEPEMDSDNAS
ncbi:DUF2852 domain-containing protein, partial [Thioclava sp. BHET1]